MQLMKDDGKRLPSDKQYCVYCTTCFKSFLEGATSEEEAKAKVEERHQQEHQCFGKMEVK